MEMLTDFTALIQLIAGVNFAFILGDFLQKALAVLFSSKKILDAKDDELNQAMAADVSSVNTMLPIVTVDGKTSEGALTSLKESYKELNEEWTSKREEILERINKVRDVNGFDTLFLAASIYSVLDLLLIACGNSIDSWTFDVFVMSFNSLTLLSFSVYIIRLWRFEAKKIVNEGKWCIAWMLIVFVFSALFADINRLCVARGLSFLCPAWLHFLFENLLCVVIPFLVIFSAICFVLFYEFLFNFQIDKSVREVTEKQVKLRQKKSELDKFYSFFKPTVGTSVTYA